jgi:hypothetical protein
MNLNAYIKWLTKRLFAMLPMSDETEDMEENHLKEYINSMSIQVDGSFKTFPELSDNVDYLTIANMLHYWDMNDIDTVIFKREVRNALNLLNRIEGDAE